MGKLARVYTSKQKCVNRILAAKVVPFCSLGVGGNSVKKPTQADVARLAGVSRATVSYVVSGKAALGVRISEETRGRVLAAVGELGYVVNAGAQALRRGDTKTLGVLLPLYENPFFWDVLRGVCAEAHELGYKVLFTNSVLNSDRADQTVSELAEQRVDGLILLAELESLPEGVMRQLRASTRPVVEISSTTSDFDHVQQDYGAGTEVLLAHLFGLGHRRVAFLYGVHKPEQGQDRLVVYRRFLEAAGIAPDERLIHRCGPSAEDGYSAARDLLQRPDPPTAIMALNDLLGIATIRAAEDLGLRVPGNVSVTGFDDIAFARFVVPRLTTVAGNPEQNGRDAVRLFVERLRRPDRPREVVTARWALRLRESTGPAPAEASKRDVRGVTMA